MFRIQNNKVKGNKSLDLIAIMLLLAIALGYVDYENLAESGNLNLELRTAISLTLAFVATLFFEEGFFVRLVILFFPNTVLAGTLLLQRQQHSIFFFLVLSQLMIIALATLFQWRLSKTFLSENAFYRMKSELGDLKENALTKILHFSLIGCLRDRQKIVEQAYHILESCFKAERSVIFIADYDNNTLVPLARAKDKFVTNIQPIMVDQSF